MTATLHSLRSLLLSVAVLLAGHGLQLTLLPLKAQELGWSSSAIGLTGSAYYLGFLLGCLSVPAMIRRVGHIRAFTVFVAVATMALLAAGLVDRYPMWLVLRFATGWALAGFYTTIESWLNDGVDNSRRGTVLALYTMISLAAMVAGQFVIQADVFTLTELFPLGAFLLVTATLPIALTSRPQPATPASVHFSWKTVFGASQVGVVTSGISGFVMGLLWSVGAVYASELAGSVEVGARFIAIVIFGGLVFQFPIGRLSDAHDRRWIILWLGGLGFLGANLWIVHPLTGPWLYVAGFLCGAAAMPMYSVSIAHANDNAKGDFLQIASGMLMANAIGAVMGPLLFAGVKLTGLPQVLMLLMALAFAAGMAWTALRLRTHQVDRAHFEPYQPLPKTTAEAAVLDPRQVSQTADEAAEPGLR